MDLEVQDGVVAFFEFEEVTDLPDQSNVRQRKHTILLTLEPEGAAGKELGRAGPFKVEHQLDGHLFKANCESTSAVLPVFQDGKSRLRVVLWYFKDNGEPEPIGATEPFNVTWDHAPSNFSSGNKPQIRHYQVFPFNRAVAKSYALTRIHMSHKLIREKTNNGPGSHHSQAHTSGHAAQSGRRAFALLQLHMLTDLPGQRSGYNTDPSMSDVVLTVEPANSSSHHEAVTAGSFPTQAQRGTHLRQADLQQRQVRVPAPPTSHVMLLHVLAWNASRQTGHLDLIAVSDPINVTTQFESDAYYPLRSQQNHAVKGKLSMSHQLIQDAESEHSATLRYESRNGPVAYMKFDHVSDLPGPPYGRGIDRGSEGRVLLTVEPPSAHEDGLELGRVGPFQATVQAGGFLHKVSCRDATVPVEGQINVSVRAWYLMPSGSRSASEAMDLIGVTDPIDLRAQSTPVQCFELRTTSGGTAGRVYLLHLLQASGAPYHRSGISGPKSLSFSGNALGTWPPHVTKFLETPQDLEEKWDRDGSATVPRTTNLRMVGGAWQIKHPHSHAALESMFICDSGSGAGVGEIFNHSMDPQRAVDAMMKAAARSCERTRVQLRTSAADRAAAALQCGCESTKNMANFAGLVAALDAPGKELGVARLGDSVLWQIRKVPGSPATGCHADLVAEAGDPHRLSSHPVHDGPGKAELYTWPVQEGDLLVLGTDGVFDNLFGHEVREFAEWTVSPLDAGQHWHEGSQSLRGPGLSTEPQRIAAAVAHAAHHRACDKLASTPISAKTSQQRGVTHVGGKLDDITVVCAWLARSSI